VLGPIGNRLGRLVSDRGAVSLHSVVPAHVLSPEDPTRFLVLDYVTGPFTSPVRPLGGAGGK
jgi:hypothetical protein